MKFKLTTASVLLSTSFVISSNTHASNLNYNGVSASYLSIDYDDSDSYNPSGFGLSGSFEVTDNIIVTGEIYSISDEETSFGQSVDFSISEFSFGAGYRFPISNSTDILIGFELGSANIEASYSGGGNEADADTSALSIGARSMLNDKVEIFGSFSRARIELDSETSNENQLNAGASYYFNSDFSVSGSLTSADESTLTKVSITYLF